MLGLIDGCRDGRADAAIIGLLLGMNNGILYAGAMVNLTESH